MHFWSWHMKRTCHTATATILNRWMWTNNANVAQFAREYFRLNAGFIFNTCAIQNRFHTFSKCIDEPKYEQFENWIVLDRSERWIEMETLQHLNNGRMVYLESFICAVDWTTLNSDTEWTRVIVYLFIHCYNNRQMFMEFCCLTSRRQENIDMIWGRTDPKSEQLIGQIIEYCQEDR